MTHYRFTNIIGTFLFNKTLELEGEVLFSEKNFQDEKAIKAAETKLAKKHKLKESQIQTPTKEQLPQILKTFQSTKYYEALYKHNLILTRQKVKESVGFDNKILNAIGNVNELDKAANLLAKRLREWFSLYLPELERKISDHAHLAELLSNNSLEQLREEYKISAQESMGAAPSRSDYKAVLALASQVSSLYELRSSQEEYLQEIMKQYCPNILEICGTTIAAKLFEHAKSLKHMALLPASTIQLLGAEKALFRHLKTGSASPKYGVLFAHYLVQRAPRNKKGMVARTLANNISIAARIDFFKGEFRGDAMKKDLEKKCDFSKK